MKVNLVGYTQPNEEFEYDFTDTQDFIAFCARVSNPGNQNNKETSKKLIKYLIKHKHWSPFEMASATLEVETTRDIARQLLRHRSFSFQEFSQRYADPNSLGDIFVLREARLQDQKNRQNSIKTADAQLKVWWDAKQKFIIDQVKEIYSEALEKGIAKEQARCILPEGNTTSRLYVNGTIRSWIHYIELRSAHGTQLEHIELAKACAVAITKIFPMIRENDMSEFVKEISTYYKEDNKGKAVVCVNTKEELTFVNYYNEKDEFIKTTAFPDKSIRYAEDAAENWSLGYME